MIADGLIDAFERFCIVAETEDDAIAIFVTEKEFGRTKADEVWKYVKALN